MSCLMMPLKKGALALVAGLLLLGGHAVQAQDAVAGKTVFDANCAVCHSIETDVVGPALKDVHKRRDEAWIKKFIHNSTALIADGDPTAKEVFEKYGKMPMPSFGSVLSEDDISSVIAYVKQESEAPTATAEAAPAATDASADATVAAAPASVAFKDLPPVLLITFALAGTVLLLIMIILVMLFRLFVPMLGDSVNDADFRSSFAGRLLFLMRGDATLFTGKATDIYSFYAQF